MPQYVIAINDTPDPDEEREPQKVADLFITIPDDLAELNKSELELRINGVTLYRAPFTIFAWQLLHSTPWNIDPRADSLEYKPSGEIIWRGRVPQQLQ